MTATESEPTEVRFLYAVFEGTMPDGALVGYSISTGTDTCPEVLRQASAMGVRGLEMQYPGVREARQIGTWTEAVMDLTTEES